MYETESPGGGREVVVLGLIFAGYVSLASQSLYPIMVYSVANFRPHLSHLWAKVIFAITFFMYINLIQKIVLK